jgi:hypothetical protein
MPVTSKEFAQLVAVVSKTRENAPKWLDAKVKAKLIEVAQAIEDSDPAVMSENDYKKHMAAAEILLKAVIKANKDGDPKAEKEETWKITKYVDKGNCAAAAKSASIDGLETAYKNAVKKYEEYGIDEGHLGVLYEKNILTKGSKYSFFFKYVRTKDHEAELHGVAIGCHDGSGYVELKKDGTKSTTKISAQKKNL